MLAFVAILLTKVLFKFDKTVRLEKKFILDEYRKIGKFSFEEKVVSIIFVTTALLWIFRNNILLGSLMIPGWSNILPTSEFINDGTIAISMAFLLFLVPSKTSKRSLLDGSAFRKVPWGIILLFGGGFALAKGFSSTGLSDFIGRQLSGLSVIHPVFIILITALLVTFLTELTSNTALTQTILPIAASVSITLGLNPLLLMFTTTLSASMAFMLPVATPPNTIIFAGGKIKTSEMAKTGLLLNLIGAIVITFSVYFLGDLVFGVNSFPVWAN
jgi:sodium-dependent dicarboxylate transporter 2/3/5